MIKIKKSTVDAILESIGLESIMQNNQARDNDSLQYRNSLNQSKTVLKKVSDNGKSEN
jgi:hypothetical protein